MKFQQRFSDARGDIFILDGGYLSVPEVCILQTKAGYARGGCIHNYSEEHLTVMEGEIEYHFRYPHQKEQMVVLKRGQGITIPPGTGHYYVSTSDSVVLEWGPTLEEKNTRDKEMRRMVEEHNKAI